MDRQFVRMSLTADPWADAVALTAASRMREVIRMGGMGLKGLPKVRCRGDSVRLAGLVPSLVHHPGPPKGNAATRRDGQARVALQATRIHLPILRDLRRHRLGVGLRAAWSGTQEEPQGPVVVLDGWR